MEKNNCTKENRPTRRRFVFSQWVSYPEMVWVSYLEMVWIEDSIFFPLHVTYFIFFPLHVTCFVIC
jgi:hypothetical protein